jgi:hypothetical protein
MEQSSIDFGYILRTNIPLRGLALIFVHATANTIAPDLLLILLHHREYRGVMEKEGKIRHIEVTENSVFCCSRVT